jgi:hypothetical protein
MKALFCFYLIFSGQVFAQSIQRIPLKVTDSYQTNYVGQNITNLINQPY